MFLKNPKSKEKLASEIVAFTNRYGSKLFIGIIIMEVLREKEF